jgi:NAD(P)-dependent dehydrogenase (short-subunit alcohol dehydrogenase family)
MVPSDQIAVVCGSFTAVGSALVTRMQCSGITVITIDPFGYEPHPSAMVGLSGDVTDETTWQSFTNAILKHPFRPALLVYAQMESDSVETLDELTQREWDRVMNHNLRGSYLACKSLFPYMQQPGAVVLLASTLASWDTRSDSTALSASGGGVLALTRSLALSAAPYHIRVNVVCYDTALQAWFGDEATRHKALQRTPLGRATSPDDIVDAILFFLSDDASYLTGSSLVVDAGQSLQSWSNAPHEAYE